MSDDQIAAAGHRPLPRVRIVQLNHPTLRALAAGDLVAANATSPVPLTGMFAGPEWRYTWSLRTAQVEREPACAEWVTGVIWDEQARCAVGRAGFHGLPDASGMVEVGYAVDPAFRRRGYARAALEFMLDRAADEPAVSVVRATISPGNLPSRQLVSHYGFVETGEQWDEVDGLEIIYEVRRAASGRFR
ncbi:GNAT family N-acetyltransferase [Nocardia sp. ET3-3]|uniref:GNAT family N-acetyltransferase n=1 Tax=Nocardia terrae TaxID=2675851 RepID=A0A7K1UR52_9NOCA|nr:GNAT family N-acetyltransferase [Nocardia terrae]MVU76826.1 GNAT family N-acetyltransferase [Nocardia terrae]